jgi:hypothetical protein
MSQASPPASVSDLLGRIRDARASLDRTLEGASDSEMTARPDDAWSAKDHLAHLDTWHRILLSTLDGRPYEAVGLDRGRYEALGLDELNTHIDGLNRDRDLDEVRRAFATSYDEVIARITALEDADLAAPVAADDPRPRVDKIIGDTYGHYDEHRVWLSRLLDRLRT